MCPIEVLMQNKITTQKLVLTGYVVPGAWRMGLGWLEEILPPPSSGVVGSSSSSNSSSSSLTKPPQTELFQNTCSKKWPPIGTLIG